MQIRKSIEFTLSYLSFDEFKCLANPILKTFHSQSLLDFFSQIFIQRVTYAQDESLQQLKKKKIQYTRKKDKRTMTG